MFDKATAMMLASTALGGMFTVLACPGLYKGGGFLLCQIFYSMEAHCLPALAAVTIGIALFDAFVLPKNLGEGEMSKAVNDEQVNDLPSLGKLTKNKVRLLP